jgi:fructose-1,6-bisphosphatase/inositol monophosphatase family enzyme
VLDLFARICDDAREVLAANDDWGLSGQRETQYAVDLSIDAVCVGRLLAAGHSVLSEESGVHHPPGSGPQGSAGLVVVDPLDGSTNASLGLPWCATALCLVVEGLPEVAMVTNLVTGDRFDAIRGFGARRNEVPIQVGSGVGLDQAIVGVNGVPRDHLGWRQFRAMGSTALDIALVAAGGFDGYVDFDDDAIAVWDYLAAVVILEEAGGVAADALGRDLFTYEMTHRRAPVAATSAALLDELLAMRRRS